MYERNILLLFSVPADALFGCSFLLNCRGKCEVDTNTCRNFSATHTLVRVEFKESERYGCLFARHEGVLGEWSQAPSILYFGTRWRWVVSFMLRSLYPHEGAAGWWAPRMICILWGRDRSLCHIGNRTTITRFTVRSIVTMLTELSPLLKIKGIWCGNCSGCRRVWGTEGKFCSKSGMKNFSQNILYILCLWFHAS